ncbi:hypothetical protein AKJ56_00795 [candidate division MSBL1 archaeon SCGC-AAA382N08]|uniref:Transposase n=1 Tax=candidate division MSBL1 archaeon SCGC-AAA382N08 TaxID=1698285 RepID=A0A133VQB9_9EURY|nr:hypothetical protein AKJ56_00795 [candidate division MSBL1 archaeon SCGC-AAA382N08]
MEREPQVFKKDGSRKRRTYSSELTLAGRIARVSAGKNSAERVGSELRWRAQLPVVQRYKFGASP